MRDLHVLARFYRCVAGEISVALHVNLLFDKSHYLKDVEIGNIARAKIVFTQLLILIAYQT